VEITVVEQYHSVDMRRSILGLFHVDVAIFIRGKHFSTKIKSHQDLPAKFQIQPNNNLKNFSWTRQ
jgi:hypothetical protein